MPPGVWIVLSLWLCSQVWQTHQAIQVWASDLTLWQHAAVASPGKPRALLNYGVALVKVGRYADAREMFTRAEKSATLRENLPAWDRTEGQQIAVSNLATLTQLETDLRRR